MSHHKSHAQKTLAEQFPPSPPCTCEICRGYCLRPGWWSVEQAAQAMAAGYGRRMMLEIAPERSFGVLAPAFKGCEANFAQGRFATQGCTFQKDGLCELFGSGLMPLECRFCHHTRPGQGPLCHAALERDWHSPAGQVLVVRWSQLSGFEDRLNLYRLIWLNN